MPRLKTAMKDAVWRRYAPGRCQATFDPEISEWGNPAVQTTACRALHRPQNIADLTQTVAEGIRMNFFRVVPRSFRVFHGQCRAWQHTRGSETSQYPEEKKSIDIPQVAASEKGGAQTPPSIPVNISLWSLRALQRVLITVVYSLGERAGGCKVVHHIGEG